MLLTPRTYRPPIWFRVLLSGLGMLCLALGLLPYWAANGNHAGDFVLPAVMLPVALLAALVSCNSWVRYDGSVLMISNGLSKKAILLKHVRAYRNTSFDGSGYYEFILDDGPIKRLELPRGYLYDAAFDEMLSQLPCLDRTG
ncbi:hypothetical protein [Aquitalea magnusonii]|uniref:PH domain-containing protein n=1 Tax=Aquitalea magnusonii TaxID=332411 RepID=A0A318IY17_9NEIS|nr:hypothetical protein [Aquitalea magnusonii]PXX38867.1 hypothetical protein DFR38_13115 [Aquitalea magnusonii]